MVATEWSDAQRQAIESRGGNVLVAAGAGAGKTAVLVERVTQLLSGEQATDVTRLLVVTFTEAAAAEMRMRIGEVLHQRSDGDPVAARQAALLNQASISTLHSFCLKLIRRYFYRLGLDPQLSIMGEEESSLLRHELYAALLEQELESDDGQVLGLLESYGGSHGQALETLVLRLLDFARSHPRPHSWLEQAAAAFSLTVTTPLEETAWLEPLLQEAQLQLELALVHLRQAQALANSPNGPTAYLPTLEVEEQHLLSWQRACGQWSELRKNIEGGFPWQRLPPVRASEVAVADKEACQVARNQAKQAASELLTGIWVRDDDQLRAELSALYVPMSCLLGLVCKLERLYTEHKAEQGQLDFADLEHYCLSLLVDEDEQDGWQPSEVAEEVRRQYDEVLVDEYQDINAVQDAILTLVSRQGEPNPNLFMVGDVKQSIYRFRLADPGLFLSRYRAYPQAGGGQQRRIDLAENYRSAQGVIDGVNFVFRQLMNGGVTEIEYGEGSELVAARPLSELTPAPVQFHLIERNSAASDAGEGDGGRYEMEDLEKEAYLAARLIEQLVAGQEPLRFYQKDGQPRQATYRDVVILMRATRMRANQVIEVLQRMNIPAHAQLGTGYFAAQEVAVVRSLLSIIDNPRQDIALAAVLRSPVVGLSAEQLASVRLAQRSGDFFAAVNAYADQGNPLAERLRSFLAQLSAWRTVARRRPINQLVWRVLTETGYYDYCGGMPGGGQRQANLRSLYDRARQFDRFANPGLFRFLRFLERLEEEHDLGHAPSLGEQENVVRIMSVHKSKGLEFPIVIVLDAGKQFNLQDVQQDVLLHRQLGLGPKLVDRSTRVKYPSLAHAACAHLLRAESLAEEMRVLYVAMTRARERLLIIGSARDLPNCCRRWGQAGFGANQSQAGTMTARSWLDWLGSSLMRHPQGEALFEHAPAPRGNRTTVADRSRWSVHIHGGDSRLPPALAPGESQLADWARISRLETLPVADDSPWEEQIAERLQWCYPHSPETELPAKVSVSDLKRAYIDSEEMSSLYQPVLEAVRKPRFLTPGEPPPDAGALGSAIHTVLSQLPLEGPMSQPYLQEQVAVLVERELLLPEWADHIPLEALTRFFASPLGQRLLRHSHSAQREVPFTLGMKAHRLFPHTTTDEFVTVQGVVDCYFKEGDQLILLDYKTDRGGAATPSLMLHQRQLGMYREALTQATALTVSEAYLVFLTTGEIVAYDGQVDEEYE